MSEQKMPLPPPVPPVAPAAAEVPAMAPQMPVAPSEPVADGVEKDTSLMKAAKAIKQVEVTATASGFYAQRRRKVGDKFVMANLSHAGSWVKCSDPVLEKKRQALLLERKRMTRAALINGIGREEY